MDLHATFPLRYFINLGRRQERRIETELNLFRAGFSAERFPAVDGRFVRQTRGYESVGRYALALTQRLVLRRAMLKKAEAVLLLEDDVIFHPDILERLDAMELPEDWGIFYLGCAHQKRPYPVSKGVVRTHYALDTHAFAVRAPYYQKVISALDRHGKHDLEHPRASDWFLANLHEEIPTYACYPNLAWQTVSSSDLTGATYSNYTATGEQIAARGETIGLQGEMWGVRRWKQTVVSEAASPKLGLLFLTREDVNHPEIWREFEAQAPDRMRVFSHSKQRSLDDGFLGGKSIAEWHETEWGGVSLVKAMMALLKAALKDESLTHFVFVSESCIPVRPWHEIERRLRLDPRTMLNFSTAAEMKAKHLERILQVTDLPERACRMHEQWCLLDREAAVCVTEADLTERFDLPEAADEHYIGSMLALRGYPEKSRINRQAPTWNRWSDTNYQARPQEFMNTSMELVGELASFPGFFARKFPVGSDVGKWGLHHIISAQTSSKPEHIPT